MYYLYNILVFITGFLLKIVSIFNKKIALFVKGRSETFAKLKTVNLNNKPCIWFHCASLGEFEQGRPIIENIKYRFPKHKIVLTFFSPSGYEVRKDYTLADVVVYLPLDSKKNVRMFLNLVKPKMAIFVKYEFWPNLLNELKNRNVETILISGIFRKDQVFFKWYGGWMRKSLQAFTHFFVQNKTSKKLLNGIGFKNITLSGDTRFDRVFEISNQDNTLKKIAYFAKNSTVLVAGSTWPEDEKLLVEYINLHAREKEKFIIAPHNIHKKNISNIIFSLNKETVLYSEAKIGSTAQVYIVDTVGLLTKIYSYADIAYVGGGFGKEGVHNVLEPATFGIPILIGPVYDKFQEVVDLIQLDACKVIENQKMLNTQLKTYFKHAEKRKESGAKAKHFIMDNIGAAQIIVDYISKKL